MSIESIECVEKNSSLSDSFHERISSTLRWGFSNIAKIAGVALAIILCLGKVPNVAEVIESGDTQKIQSLYAKVAVYEGCLLYTSPSPRDS